MFQYNNIEFYSSYCEQLTDFLLIENFEQKGNNYIGKIAAKRTIHKLEIEVTIPVTFPHNKLKFETNSLYGYPHLILGQNGLSWFCLNSAFAETAREQLDEEFNRLRRWIKLQMRPELPAIIKKEETRIALTAFQAHKNGNGVEIAEFISNKNQLTFVGDFAKDPTNFKESGELHCVKHQSEKITVFQSPIGMNEKLPYVVVDHFPKNMDGFSSLVEEFGWSNELCEKLLPDFNWGKKKAEAHFKFKEGYYGVCKKDEIESDYAELCQIIKERTFHKEDLSIIKDSLSKFVDYCNNRWKGIKMNLKDPEIELYEEAEFNYHIYQYSYHYFALAIKKKDDLYWLLIKTNRDNIKYSKRNFDLGRYEYEIKTVSDISFDSSSTNKIITYDDYFGRGRLSDHLVNKKILLIGLGAIGSYVAESLARGGAKHITVCDGDLVEPGNICRASYENNSIGENKASAITKKIKAISPFCNVNSLSDWYYNRNTQIYQLENHDFYGDVNYESQKSFIQTLEKYDIIIDCTASNELLHFLSYAVKDRLLLSLCITNRSQNCLLLSNSHANPFELRKHYLSRIEQDTKNYYVEGTGCYAPTFVASGCDIIPFANLAVRKLSRNLEVNKKVSSTIWNYEEDTISADELLSFKLENSSIRLIISQKTREAALQLPILKDGSVGYLVGGYSIDRTEIFATHIIGCQDAESTLEHIQKKTEGILYFIGIFTLSGREVNEPPLKGISQLKALAHNSEVNTNNPLLALLNSDGTISFSLFIGEEIVPFECESKTLHKIY
ncbi:MAG: ThiF family adenylyltransferase [Phocaeicola sp.]